jgi:lysophospholipase L1-like esterase
MNETPQLGKNGFLPLSIRFDPKTYYQKYSQVSGYYDSDYQGFELSGVQTNALKKLVEYVQSQQVEIVFVNMPLTQDYLDSVRMAYEQKFQEHMQQMESETGLIFIDLGLEWLQTYEYYSDPSHLNQYGAAAVAERLAEKQQIPWPSR